MGKGSEGIGASSDGESNGLGSCEADDVSSSPQEDRSGTAGEVGEGEGSAEEGRVVREPPTTRTGFQP
jgi:hypothetical protein